MTKPRPKNAARYITDTVDAELRRLRFKVEQLEAQVRKERRRADKHADELAVARHELMFLQEQQVDQVRRAMNGVMR